MKNRVTFTLGFCIATPVLAIKMPPPVLVQSIDFIPASAVRIGQGYQRRLSRYNHYWAGK